MPKDTDMPRMGFGLCEAEGQLVWLINQRYFRSLKHTPGTGIIVATDYHHRRFKIEISQVGGPK